MFRFFRRTVTTRTTAPDGTVREQTTQETTDDPAATAAEAEVERLLADADGLFAAADKMFAAHGFATVAGRPFSRAAQKKQQKQQQEEKPPEPAPDFLAAAPGSAAIAVLGTLNVFRYKGRYYAYSSRDAIKPAGYHALDTMRPSEGQS